MMACRLPELRQIYFFMPVKTFRPLTPSTRYITSRTSANYEDDAGEVAGQIRKKTGGRNHYGRVTARGIGGGHKQKIRLVDFKRNKHGVEAMVAAIEYDPMRSARLALLQYKDGEKRYIIAPVGVKVGAQDVQRADGAARSRQRASAQGDSGQLGDSQYGTDSRPRRADGSLGGRFGDADVARRGVRADPSALR